MSDVAPFDSGHDACKTEGTAHVMGFGFTLCRWPCGLELQIDTTLGRVSYVDSLWTMHEQWMETNGNQR